MSALERVQMKETISKRCGCRDEDGKQLNSQCPKMDPPRHGLYQTRFEIPPRKDGTRRAFSRGGFKSEAKAVEVRDDVRALLTLVRDADAATITRLADLLEKVSKEKLPIPNRDEISRRLNLRQPLTEELTTGDYLDRWVARRKGKRRTGTLKNNEGHIRNHLKPALGHIPLLKLNKFDIEEMFASIGERNIEIAETNALRRGLVDTLNDTRKHAARRALMAQLEAMPPFRRVTGPTTQIRILATLRKAIADAIPSLLTVNHASFVELATVSRPKPMVWTDERVEHWQRTGEKPCPVMVWTPRQIGVYLDHTEKDRLGPMWALFVKRGLRRGEGCGLREVDFEKANKRLRIAEQLVQMGATTELSAPKTRSGERFVGLDLDSMKGLEAQKRRRAKEKLACGPAWVESGRIFTKPNGEMLYPEWVSERHVQLCAKAGLPPVRLHDLRHCAATVMAAAGLPIEIIQATLGHATAAITRDTYVHLYDEALHEAAELSASIIPRARGQRAQQG
ncbi:site-specific integrase [Lentzea albidocapillata]|uniref:site-specific integrase n=1 Tax=Lentzea albidocapillata TaxID=40571 RepID=UPI0015A42EC5|nr:site-specific integrase [Lentzea albidocapillata]